jgi:hypothetical protein
LDKLLTSTPSPRENSTFFGAPNNKFLPKDLKARFSELPLNPPPQGPLPEKPSDFPNQPLLRRAESEKPKASSPQVSTFNIFDQSSNSQITALAAALDSVKKDYENQGKKIRDLQDLLVQERVRASQAEARAHQLENLNIEKALPVKKEEQNVTPIEDEANSEIGTKQKAPSSANESATTKLQQRLDLVLAELQQVKENSELWRHEKEKAEKERDQERKERLSFMEMIEAQRKIEKENIARRSRSRSRRRNRSKSGSSKALSDPSVTKAISSNKTDNEDLDERRDSLSTPSPGSPRQSLFTNGHADPTLQILDGKGGTVYFERSHLIHAAPYISAMSVVLIGVAVMTLVNHMSRGEK